MKIFVRINSLSMKNKMFSFQTSLNSSSLQLLSWTRRASALPWRVFCDVKLVSMNQNTSCAASDGVIWQTFTFHTCSCLQCSVSHIFHWAKLMIWLVSKESDQCGWFYWLIASFGSFFFFSVSSPLKAFRVLTSCFEITMTNVAERRCGNHVGHIMIVWNNHCCGSRGSSHTDHEICLCI